MSLVEADDEFDRDMNNACEFGTCSIPQIRDLFISILLFCEISDQLGFFQNHKLFMVEDRRPQHPNDDDDEQLERRVIIDLQTSCFRNGTSLH